MLRLDAILGGDFMNRLNVGISYATEVATLARRREWRTSASDTGLLSHALDGARDALLDVGPRAQADGRLDVLDAHRV